VSGLDLHSFGPPPYSASSPREWWFDCFVCWDGRYNKTLLGDKLGKFPAPLLMNTVHFALQAGLSKLIIFFQPKGPDSAVEMGWKDHFVRGVDLGLQPIAAVICVCLFWTKY
jgi:hypothetical protein